MDKLFFAPGTCATASHIALAEAGASYRVVRLNFAAGEQRSPSYLSINPKGRVPALVTDRGIITETPAILLYIAQSHPSARLAPLSDPFALAKLQEFNNYLCSTVHINHAHRMRGARWSDDAAIIEGLKVKVAQNMADNFEYIERELFKGPWVMGDQYSVCDGYLYTVTAWLESDSVDPKRFPKVFEHSQRMAERPAVQQAIAEQKAA